MRLSLFTNYCVSLTRLLIPSRNFNLTVGLYSTGASATGGDFGVNMIRAKKSPVYMNFADAPPDARLSIDVSTTQADAYVRLHPSFEGSFALKTSGFHPEVRWPETIEDPSGRGRTREGKSWVVQEGIVNGSVVWGEGADPVGKGEVMVRTDAAQLVLDMGSPFG